MSDWWHMPFLMCIALSMAVLVWRPALHPLERVWSFFGIGGVEASVAEALVLGTAGLFGLLFNAAAGDLWAQDYGPPHLALGLGSGLGLGLGLAWLAGRLR